MIYQRKHSQGWHRLLNSLVHVHFSINIPAGLAPFISSCLVCWAIAHNPQHQRAKISPNKPPSKPYFSLIFFLVMTAQQSGQQITGIKSPSPHSCSSIAAFWYDSWHVAQSQETKRTLISEKQSKSPVSHWDIVQ